MITKTDGTKVPETRSEIMDLHWLEFLAYVKEDNLRANGYGKDASEINFWHWYIDNKLKETE